jgi:hypothetical protein
MSGTESAGAAAWVWSNREGILKTLKKLYGWFRTSWPWGAKKRGILILGTGGVGKTTLAKLLSGSYNWLLDNPGRYEESIDIEKYIPKGGPSVEVLVPPGQKHRRESTWADLHADIGKGKFSGIILLTAYGYDTLGQISVENHKLFTGDRHEFLQKYLEDRRKDELAVLRELAPHMKVSTKKLWMLTVVAKEDLWWDKHSQVDRYYRTEKYGAELQKVIGKQDPKRFRHEFAFASLVISNFNTGKGDCLQPNVAGYDHQMQVESLRRLFQTFAALKNWEEAP